MRRTLAVLTVFGLIAVGCQGGEPAQPDALSISTTTLPGAIVGAPYAATLAAAGGETPYAFAVTAGALPNGLALASSGRISGTPLEVGSFSFTVQVTDAAQASATQAFSIQVAASGGLTIVTNSLPIGQVGSSYQADLVASGGTAPYAWLVATGTLPDGLALSAAGQLTGTPTTQGSFTFAVQVTDSSATPLAGQATFTITINPNPSQVVSITTGVLPPATVGLAYQAQLAAAGGAVPYTWSVLSGTLPDGLALATTGDISGTPTVAGSFTFTLEAADSSTPAQTAAKQFTVTVSAGPGQSVSITTAALPNGIVGNAYNANVTAAGGTAPYTFAVASGTLPPGITLASDGSFSGTPTTAGSFTFTLQVTDSAATPESAQRSYTVSIAPAAGQLAIITMALPRARVGLAYNASLNAISGAAPYHWTVSAGSLPAGLTLSEAGDITGTPSAAGASTFTVTVTDSSATPSSASKQLTMTVGN